MVWERRVVRVIVQGEKKQNKETTVYIWARCEATLTCIQAYCWLLAEWLCDQHWFKRQCLSSSLLLPCASTRKERKKEIQLGPRRIQNGRQSPADWEQCKMTNGGGECGAGGALVKTTRFSFPPFFPYAATCDPESPSVLRQSQVKW